MNYLYFYNYWSADNRRALIECNKMKSFDNFSRAMRLSVAYAANVGGTATITGSPTNLVAKEMLDM